jgi:hypothetical protein
VNATPVENMRRTRQAPGKGQGRHADLSSVIPKSPNIIIEDPPITSAPTTNVCRVQDGPCLALNIANVRGQDTVTMTVVTMRLIAVCSDV